MVCVSNELQRHQSGTGREKGGSLTPPGLSHQCEPVYQPVLGLIGHRVVTSPSQRKILKDSGGGRGKRRRSRMRSGRVINEQEQEENYKRGGEGGTERGG